MTSAFTPVYPGAAKLSGRFPKALESGSLLKFNEDSYWWWVTLVANYAGRFYSVSIDMVQDAQASLEERYDCARSEAMSELRRRRLVERRYFCTYTLLRCCQLYHDI